MRRSDFILLPAGMAILACCGGCLISASGTTAGTSSLDALAGQLQTFAIDFVRQMLAAVLM